MIGFYYTIPRNKTPTGNRMLACLPWQVKRTAGQVEIIHFLSHIMTWRVKNLPFFNPNMLVVANLVYNTCIMMQKILKNDQNPYRHMCTHLRELNESYPMNTNMTGFR